MIKIYSKVDVSLLLHTIITPHDFMGKELLLITEPPDFLQSLALRLNEGDARKAHKHLEVAVDYTKKQQQEAWVILGGSVQCTLYDIDDTFLYSYTLTEKCALYTFYGGHELSVLADNTIILEFKTGPYRGNITDKTFINK